MRIVLRSKFVIYDGEVKTKNVFRSRRSAKKFIKESGDSNLRIKRVVNPKVNLLR